VSDGVVRVIDAGLMTAIQDARGRPGLGRFGVPPGGAMDADAARLANRLVGGRGDEPVLEITLHGPVLAWEAPALVGLAGADLGAEAEHLRLAPGHAHHLAAGAVLAFRWTGDARRGARAYLAVEGGFQVEPVLGSASTDRRSGFGGVGGRELRTGDSLRFRAGTPGPLRSLVRADQPSGDERQVDPQAPAEIRVVSVPVGPDWFGPDALPALLDASWTVTADSDRNGIRLGGATRVPVLTGRIPSLGVPVGSVQVPASGEPIVTMVDGPVTGGYPVIGVVPRSDHGHLAQLAPGAAVRFRAVDVATARELARAAAEASTHDRIELDPGDVGAAWAG
jgi:biotin-dependent carboxylase-like uncharacterized protein